ncbi:MAG: TCR/Tet family MFS transporter [Devosiaceae bacterium]|nr:TCR/Tet family MFS transporter [Devosiaceae bacterium]
MNKALVVILLSVTIDAIGIGLIFPILPSLLRELTASSEITILYGIIIAGYALMLFLFAPLLGMLSDRFGRRPILMIAMGGAAIDYLIMAFAPTIEVLIIGRLIAGMTAASMAVASAYITDISKDDERAKYFGFLGACFGVGFIIGPALGGLLGEIWLRAPFLAAAILNGINLLLAIFLLPESRKGKKTGFNFKKLNPFAPIMWALKLISVRQLLVIAVFFAFVGTIYSTIWVLFTQDKFLWSGAMVGLSLTAYGVCMAVAQSFSGMVSSWLGEKRAILFGLFFEIAALIIVAFIGQGWMIFLLLPLFAFGEVGGPALQSLLTSKISEDLQGQLQGVLMSLAALASVVGPLFFTQIYAIVRPEWPGSVWLIAAAIYIILLPFIIFGGSAWQRISKKSD